MELEAQAEVDADFQAWEQEFLGHRAGGTISAPNPAPQGQGGPGPAATEGGSPDTVGPTPGGSDLGGQLSGAPGAEVGGGSAPGGY